MKEQYRNMAIRILHVAQAAGGVDRYIRMLLKYLDKDKFENILVCSQDFKKEDYEGLVDAFEQIEMNRAIGVKDLKLIWKVRKLIKKYNPDIVYAHSSKAGAIARIADIGCKNYCVYNPHGWAFNMRCSDKKRIMYIAIEKMAAQFCDKIICISEAEKKSALEKKICRENKLHVIFNGVDIEAYESGEHSKVKRKELCIPEDAFVVGMVGRISSQKAPDVFVKMAKLVKEEVPNAHFIIVGNGDMEAEIRKYAEDNDFSENLHITGWVDNPMNYVELFDVACLLSRWEGFGLALPEYMMAGKPIVASRVDAIPYIIRNEKNGLLVNVDDADGASDAVLRIYQKNELKNKFVTQGLKDVHDRFDARRVSEQHGMLFENMIR
jgi:glycosyltransferase involved in cell wall biosynthesis